MIQVAFINGNKEATSSPVYQWDYGRWLLIYGIESNEATIQVHFYDRSCERAIVRLATFCGTDKVNNVDVYYKVQIPDGLLENSYSISAYIYLVSSECGNTTHHISIPVIARKKPEGFISKPDESQTTLLEQALIDINEVSESLVEKTTNVIEYVDGELNRVSGYAQDNSSLIQDLDIRIESLENELSDVTGTEIENIKSKVNEVGSNVSKWASASGQEYLDYNISAKGLYAITYVSEYDNKYYTIYLSITNTALNHATTGVFNSPSGFVTIGFTWSTATQKITQDSTPVKLHMNSVHLITPYDKKIS